MSSYMRTHGVAFDVGLAHPTAHVWVNAQCDKEAAIECHVLEVDCLRIVVDYRLPGDGVGLGIGDRVEENATVENGGHCRWKCEA